MRFIYTNVEIYINLFGRKSGLDLCRKPYQDCVKFNLIIVVSYLILCVLTHEKDSPDQQHGVANLVQLLKNGGFFRDTNGLNNLQTFKRFAQLMNMPNGFTVEYVAEPISTFINNFSQSKLVQREISWRVHFKMISLFQSFISLVLNIPISGYMQL